MAHLSIPRSCAVSGSWRQLSTVSAVLLRIGLGKLSRLEPPEPANRYQRRRAGELVYGPSRKRATALDGWVWTYNHRRPHGALNHKPPIARLNELNNLAGSYT
jgi:hypothetical protein